MTRNFIPMRYFLHSIHHIVCAVKAVNNATMLICGSYNFLYMNTCPSSFIPFNPGSKATGINPRFI